MWMKRDCSLKLEGTRSRFRNHADDWLRYLANVNEARSKHPQNRTRLVSPPSECRWIAVLVCKVLICKMNLLTLWPWPLTFEPQNSITSRVSQLPRSFPTPSLNILGSFVFELCSGQTDKYTNKQTNRHSRKSYPRRRPTDIVGVGNEVSLCSVIDHVTFTFDMSIPKPCNF